MRIASRLRNIGQKFLTPQPFATIGALRIQMPQGSKVADYKRKFTLYDTALGEIAGAIQRKYHTFKAIDIGANVGDTAAIIRAKCDAQILCIEGDPKLIPILKANLAALGESITIEPSYIGEDGSKVNVAKVDDLGWNSSLMGAAGKEGQILLRSIDAVLSEHQKFRDARLLKIDTEGFDFEILRQSASFLAKSKPLVFFEYDPHFHPEQPTAGVASLRQLQFLGYTNFIVYDNFGNLITRISAGMPDVIRYLNAYLISNRKHGVAVYYFDICAIHESDDDLASAITEARLAAMEA